MVKGGRLLHRFVDVVVLRSKDDTKDSAKTNGSHTTEG